MAVGWVPGTMVEQREVLASSVLVYARSCELKKMIAGIMGVDDGCALDGHQGSGSSTGFDFARVGWCFESRAAGQPEPELRGALAHQHCTLRLSVRPLSTQPSRGRSPRPNRIGLQTNIISPLKISIA